MILRTAPSQDRSTAEITADFATNASPAGITYNAITNDGSPIVFVRPRSMTHSTRAILALLLLTAIATPLPAADEADAHRKMIEQQKKFQDQRMARMEALPGGKRRIDQLFGFSMEEGKLVLKCKIDPADLKKNRQVKVDVEGFETPCTLTVYQVGGPNGMDTQINFSNVTYPNNEGTASLSINCQSSYLYIARSFNSRERNHNVNFSQASGRARFGQPDGCQLSVFSSDRTGRMNSNLNVQAPDFLTLRRKHPDEIREHLRPLMFQLNLESLFAVESITAWQVFSDQWPGDPSLVQAIKRLIPALDSDTFQEREQATTELRKLGPLAALSIYLMQRDGLTFEQNQRLDAIVAAHSFLSRAEAQRLRSDADFLLDCLYCEDATIRRLAGDHLAKLTKEKLPFDVSAPVEQRSSGIEALRKKLAKAKVPATAPSTRPGAIPPSTSTVPAING